MALCSWLIRSRRMVRVLAHDAQERSAPQRFSLAGHARILQLAVVMLLTLVVPYIGL
jgi:hypothetical protein